MFRIFRLQHTYAFAIIILAKSSSFNIKEECQNGTLDLPIVKNFIKFWGTFVHD